MPLLRLFGVPTLRLPNGETHLFVADRAHQLLAMLACRDGWTARAELAEWLWPERPPTAGLNNLRKVLLLAQRAIADSGTPAIELRPGLCRWNPDSDLRRFELACDEQRTVAALAHWGEPLMQSMDTGLSETAREWLDFERARLAARWRTQAAARLARLEDEPAEAIAVAQALLRVDPFDEVALTALVRARLQQGQAAIALRELHGYGEAVRAQFGIEPSNRLRSLTEQAQRAGGDIARPWHDGVSGQAKGHALPPDFIGRRLELMQLRDWLRREQRRVVSLTGAGGVGKTRVARALLALLAADGGPQACWVALADLDAAAALPLRLSAALGLPLTGATSADAWHAVVEHLRLAPALLVLDNGEQVDGLGPALSTLLQRCPQLQVLNVSRTRLGLSDEWLVPLEGMPLPDSDERDTDLLRRNDAVALFEQRARAAWPGFELGQQAAAVVRFVHAVDGLPLAIELGAALVRLLPVAQIETEVTRAGMPALDASFELSWQQLTGPERQALHALACLPVDVDLVQAERVARAPLALLSALADKSLLRADGSGRFTLHPLLQRWAAQRLQDAAQRAALEERHTVFVTHLLAELGRHGASAPQALVATLRTSWGHVAAAWQRAVAGSRIDFIAGATPVIQRFFELHGGWDDGLALFTNALSRFEAAETGDTARARMQLLRAMGALEVRCGRFVQAEAHARNALRLALHVNDRPLVCAALTTLGLSVFSRGLYRQAQQIFAQCLRRSRGLGDPVRLDVALGNLAITEMALGRFAGALAIFEELVARCRGRQEPGGLIVYLSNAGEAHRGLRNWPAALAAYQESLTLCDSHGVRSRRVTKLLNMATVEHALDHLDLAAALLEEALTEARIAGDHSNEVATLLARATLRLDTGDLRSARADLVVALDATLAMDSADLAVRCALVWGEMLHAQEPEALGRGWIGWSLSQPELYAVERVVALHRLGRRGLGETDLASSHRPDFEVPTAPRDAALTVRSLLACI